MAVEDSNTKFCKKCNAVTARYKGGVCKPCADTRNAAYRAANREKNSIAAIARRVERLAALASMTVKTCTKCGQEKGITEFRLQKRRNNIPMSSCKSCESMYQKAVREKSPRRRAEIVRRSAQKHKDKIAEKNRQYRINNIEAYRVHTRNRRARQIASGVLSKGIAKKLYSLQRGKCACCGLPLGDDYHLDHIMPLALGGTNTDNNIQLLRATCNRQKNAMHPVDFMRQRGFLL